MVGESKEGSSERQRVEDRRTLKMLFNMIDRDASGQVDRVELLRALSSAANARIRKLISDSQWLRPLLHRRRLEKLFKQMDKDDDGKLSFIEFETFWEHHRPETKAPSCTRRVC